MPKSISIEPREVLASGAIRFSDIPVNAYARTVAEELEIYSAAELLHIWRDMCAIREFETILQEIKTKGVCQGFAYRHAGPAHLSIGQEAAAVGMAFALTPGDHIFGSHRSHGEILAKGFSAIRQLSDEQLLEIMEGYRDGAILRPVEKGYGGDVHGLAERFFVYGAYSEIFARETGFNRGLGGSMHAFFTPFGIYPNNAIVGGSGSIAPGAALYKRVNRKPGIVVPTSATLRLDAVRCGKASRFRPWTSTASCGTPSLGGGLPDRLQLHEQFLRHGRPALGETMGVQFIARIGAGVNPEQMHAERVNGYDPLPVIDAFRRKKQMLAEGRGPVLLDTVTYRFSGHSPSDASSYRSKEEIEHWQQADSIPAFREKLLASGGASPKRRWRARGRTSKPPSSTCSNWPPTWTPARAWRSTSELVGEVMFSNQRVERFDDRVPEFRQDLDAQPARAADSRQDSHAAVRGQADPQDQGVQRARRHLRGACCTASRSTRR